MASLNLTPKELQLLKAVGKYINTASIDWAKVADEADYTAPKKARDKWYPLRDKLFGAGNGNAAGGTPNGGGSAKEKAAPKRKAAGEEDTPVKKKKKKKSQKTTEETGEGGDDDEESKSLVKAEPEGEDDFGGLC